MRQSVGHRSVQEGSDETTGTQRIDVTSRPHIAHAGVSSEDRVAVSQLVEQVSDVLRVDRLHVLDIAGVRADRSLHNLGVTLDGGLEELVIMLLEQRGDSIAQGLDVGVDREGDVGTTAQLLRAVLNLNREGAR